MIGDIYELRFMRWKVSKTFWRNGEQWVALKCLDKRKRAWEMPITFLQMMDKRKVS